MNKGTPGWLRVGAEVEDTSAGRRGVIDLFQDDRGEVGKACEGNPERALLRPLSSGLRPLPWWALVSTLEKAQ